MADDDALATRPDDGFAAAWQGDPAAIAAERMRRAVRRPPPDPNAPQTDFLASLVSGIPAVSPGPAATSRSPKAGR